MIVFLCIMSQYFTIYPKITNIYYMARNLLLLRQSGTPDKPDPDPSARSLECCGILNLSLKATQDHWKNYLHNFRLN